MLLSLLLLAAPGPTPVGDTLRIEVGSPLIDGRVYRPHAARVRVHIGSTDSPVVAEWTNALTTGDSAGRPVMRWVTRGTRQGANGPLTWEILQTYDHRTLAPLGYLSRSSAGASTQLVIDGTRVRGSRTLPSDGAAQPYELSLDRMGFIASASDLVPAAAGMREGRVIIAPVWGPQMAAAEWRAFTIVGRTPLTVEGREWTPWKVEERRESDGRLMATWYLLEHSPYMIYGEVPLPDGRIQVMTEVEVTGETR